MLVNPRDTPSSKFAGTHLYTRVKRGTVRVKCLAQEHNAVPWPGLEPGPLDPESSALTIRPPHLPQTWIVSSKKQEIRNLVPRLCFPSRAKFLLQLHGKYQPGFQLKPFCRCRCRYRAQDHFLYSRKRLLKKICSGSWAENSPSNWPCNIRTLPSLCRRDLKWPCMYLSRLLSHIKQVNSVLNVTSTFSFFFSNKYTS